ncbi:MAG TPA: response regulator [Gemmatimonadales bacterium]|nr:response regulator [Gemmatimonadales bacterium]
MSAGPRPRALVVTPDGPARRLAVRTLEAAGYNTLETDDSRQALHLLIDHGERLAVAVVGAQLPIMAGHHLADFVRRFFPQLPVVEIGGGEASPFSAETILEELARAS